MLLVIPPLGHSVWQLAPLALAVCFLQVSYAAGYFVTYGDLCGPHTGAIYSFSLLLSYAASMCSQLTLVAMTPNGTDEEKLAVFLLAAALNVFGVVVYIIFGSAERQEWAKQKQIKDEK